MFKIVTLFGEKYLQTEKLFVRFRDILMVYSEQTNYGVRLRLHCTFNPVAICFDDLTVEEFVATCKADDLLNLQNALIAPMDQNKS